MVCMWYYGESAITSVHTCVLLYTLVYYCTHLCTTVHTCIQLYRRYMYYCTHRCRYTLHVVKHALTFIHAHGTHTDRFSTALRVGCSRVSLRSRAGSLPADPYRWAHHHHNQQQQVQQGLCAAAAAVCRHRCCVPPLLLRATAAAACRRHCCVPPLLLRENAFRFRGRFLGPFLGFIESHFFRPRQDDPHGLRNQQIPSP